MTRMNWIGLDVHCDFCQGGYVTQQGKEKGDFHVDTRIALLIEQIQKVPEPRKLVIEEGPLADWLARHLADCVDEVLVCDPYRNALIAKDGDKTDAIDWRKLAHLARGGYTRKIHHPQTLERSLLRQHVQLYHERVRHRVAEGHKIIWRARGFGVIVCHRDLSDPVRRERMLLRLPQEKIVQQDMQLLLENFDLQCRQEQELRSRLITLGKQDPLVRRLCKVPGIKWVRATSFVAIMDTPYRFASKQKLWKYAGIGLEKRHSGRGQVRLAVPIRFNRILKNVLIGAAKSAIRSGHNLFAEQYQRSIDAATSPRIARRNVARSLASVMLGMSKNGREFDPPLAPGFKAVCS